MASGRPQAVWLLLAVGGLLALAVLAPAASGHHLGIVKPVGAGISETITVPENNWTAYAFDMNAGDTLAYDVTVTTGGAIDLYIVSDVGLAQYVNDSQVQFLVYAEIVNNRTFVGAFGDATGYVAVPRVTTTSVRRSPLRTVTAVGSSAERRRWTTARVPSGTGLASSRT